MYFNATGNGYAITLVYDKSDPVEMLAWKDTYIMERHTRKHSCDSDDLKQCFWTAGPRPGTGPREVLLEFVILVF